MATSGLIKGTVTQRKAYYNSYIYWYQDGPQSIENNDTPIRAQVLIDTSSTAYNFNGLVSNFVLKINGQTYSPGNFNAKTTDGWSYSAANSPTGRAAEIIYSTTLQRIPHNSDGTKTFSASCTFSLNSGGYGPGNVSISGTGTLNTIPRATNVTSVGTATIDGGTNSFSVGLDIKSTSFTHTLTLKVGSQTIGTRSNVTASNYTWTLNSTEKNALFAIMKNSTSCTITIYCQTFSGGVQVGSTTSRTGTCNVASSIVPTFTSITAEEAVPSVATTVGKFVQNLSKIKLTINGASGSYSSTISSYKITFNGVTYNSQTATTPVITKSGTLTATATVTDSRGRTSAAKTVNVVLLPYSRPSISKFTVQRCKSDGTLDDLGTYAKVTCTATVASLLNTSKSPSERNTLTYTIYSKVRTSSTYQTIKTATTLPAGTLILNNVSQVFGGYSATDSFDFKIVVQDKFNSTEALEVLSAGSAVMSWGKTGVGIGKIWEQGALDVGGASYFRGNIDARNVRLRVARFYTLTSWADQLDGDPRCWNIHVPSTTGTPSVQLGYTNNNGDRFTYTLTHDHPYSPTSHTHNYLPLGGGTMSGVLRFSNVGDAIIFNSAGDNTIRYDNGYLRIYNGTSGGGTQLRFEDGGGISVLANTTISSTYGLLFNNPTGRASQIRTTTTSGRQFLVLSADDGESSRGGQIHLYGTNDSSYPKYIFGYSGGTNSFRCSGSGNFHVYGSLSKASGTFRIDHPLDPENKDLIHGFVEAPRYDLIYRGVTRLENGRAIVNIDHDSRMTEGTFEALTQNAVVVSLCNQSGFARVKPTEVVNGSFSIICEDDESTDTIAWVVLAERADVFIRYHDGTCVDENGQLVPEQLKETLTEDNLELLTTNEGRKMALGEYTELENTALGNTEIENYIELGNLRGFRGYLLNPEEYRIKQQKETGGI